MAREIKLPLLGENVDSATVVSVLVSAGDTIEENQPIVELDTEKASVEVPASASGKVEDIRVKEGDTIKVGQVILTLSEDGAGKRREEKEKEEKKKRETPRKPDTGKTEEKKTPAAEVPPKETPKEPEAPAPKEPEPAPAPAEPAASEPAESQREAAPAAPSLRRMARELGVDINEVAGTGPGGRIAEEDVRNYARSIILNASGPKDGTGPRPLPDFSRWGAIERKPMTAVRRRTAEHVQESWSSIPHVTHFDSADVTELEQLRKDFSKKAEQAGGKLTVTAIALKVVASALKVFPHFNASLDAERAEIIQKKYCHIGVAVDTDRGLLVPVIRDVDRKNILGLSLELNEVAEKARTGKLGIEDMQGGTFTITNLGGIGGYGFTPIVNSPEVAILGISRASTQPVLHAGSFEPRLILPLSLSYDHRAIDGAAAARFLRWVAEALQEPFLLSFEG